jgi:hypothetical protein
MENCYLNIKEDDAADHVSADDVLKAFNIK